MAIISSAKLKVFTSPAHAGVPTVAPVVKAESSSPFVQASYKTNHGAAPTASPAVKLLGPAPIVRPSQRETSSFARIGLGTLLAASCDGSVAVALGIVALGSLAVWTFRRELGGLISNSLPTPFEDPKIIVLPHGVTLSPYRRNPDPAAATKLRFPQPQVSDVEVGSNFKAVEVHAQQFTANSAFSFRGHRQIEGFDVVTDAHGLVTVQVQGDEFYQIDFQKYGESHQVTLGKIRNHQIQTYTLPAEASLNRITVYDDHWHYSAWNGGNISDRLQFDKTLSYQLVHGKPNSKIPFGREPDLVLHSPRQDPRPRDATQYHHPIDFASLPEDQIIMLPPYFRLLKQGGSTILRMEEGSSGLAHVLREDSEEILEIPLYPSREIVIRPGRRLQLVEACMGFYDLTRWDSRPSFTEHYPFE